MQVIVLKVRYQENLEELAQTIRRGRTLDGSDGGWRMPVTAQPGDLAIWYAASPDQEYVAYGWIAGLPSKREPTRQPYGPVAGVRPLPGGPMPRAEVATKAHGFQEMNVGQLAVTVPEEIEGAFLRALGFGKRFVEVRELISVEVARVVAPAPPRKIWHTARWPIGTPALSTPQASKTHAVSTSD